MVIKGDPGAKEKGCALPLLRKAPMEGGETRWDLRHCWHNTARLGVGRGATQKRGGQVAAQACLQPTASRTGCAATAPGAPQLLHPFCARANPSVQRRQVSGSSSRRFNCSGAEGDAKAGLKAEMDALGWQRRAGEEGEGVRTEMPLRQQQRQKLAYLEPAGCSSWLSCGRGSSASGLLTPTRQVP